MTAALFVSLLIQAQTQPKPQTQTPPPPPFAQIVSKAFDAWDLDKNGSISLGEVDKLALDPKFHGEQAAALAALHKWLTIAVSPPDLTKQWFIDYKPGGLKIPKGTEPNDARKMRKDYAKQPDSLQSSYLASLKRLSRANRTALFGESGPTLDDIRQGALGDCYFLAPLGAVVERNPDDVKKMIKPEGSGYSVHFSDGTDVPVTSLTDTELAMAGASTKSGLWIRVMERAYSRRKLTAETVDAKEDAMMGGSPAAAGKALTGHKFSGIALFGTAKKEITDEQVADKIKVLDAAVKEALAAHMIITAGTPAQPMPKSISPSHAYAVIGIDAAKGTIDLWNPHGNDFNPKGEPGKENGFKIENGKFTMPLDLFVRTFGRIYIEGADTASGTTGSKSGKG